MATNMITSTLFAILVQVGFSLESNFDYYYEYFDYVHNCRRDAAPSPTVTPTNPPTMAPTIMAPTAFICVNGIKDSVNGIKDSNKTDVDCGGVCSPCSDSEKCLVKSDCKSSTCDS